MDVSSLADHVLSHPCMPLPLTTQDSDSNQLKEVIHNCKLPEHFHICEKDNLLVPCDHYSTNYSFTCSLSTGVPQVLTLIKARPTNNADTEKTTQKAHFIPLFSNKMIANGKSPPVFLLNSV